MATMTHPELPGRTIDVEVAAVPIHMASGWVPVDGKATAAAEAAAKAQAEADEAAEVAPAAEDEATASTRKTRTSKES